mgnify:CR=1 FL=1|tara:strand:- start:420 stop:611 length:192 start_codon:yes stop_codon:yes gene_type:complete
MERKEHKAEVEELNKEIKQLKATEKKLLHATEYLLGKAGTAFTFREALELRKEVKGYLDEEIE